MILSYFGPAHYGWQRQVNPRVEDKSVQEALERAIFKITSERSVVYGSGRTDSGVHALAQCAHFDNSKVRMDAQILRRALNANLPETIRVSSVIERFDAFHARFSTFLREYEYVMMDDRRFGALDLDRAWHLRKIPDEGVMNRMLALLIGEDADFSAFDFAKASDGHSTKRDVLRCSCAKRDGALAITITANAFLYHMARAIVGSAVMLALKFPENEALRKFSALRAAQAQSDGDGHAVDCAPRAKAPLIAPAHGLYLKRIIYDEAEYEAMRAQAFAKGG